MLNIKHILILAVLFGVMLWSTSNTLSLFANQHSFYNESAPCIKCHNDIQLQIEDTGRVTTLHRTQDANYGCVSCHANPNNTMNRTAFGDYHSAYSPYCIECHNNASSIYGTQEAHTKIVTEANTSKLKLDINEACAMCHTTLLDSVTVRNREVFAFENDSIIVNGSAEYDGTYTTTFSNPEPKGLHNYNSGVQCIMCHAPVQDIISQDRVPYSNHIILGCKDCHRNNNTGTEEFHAAKIIYCSDCHDLSTHQPSFSRDCNQCHESHGGLKETKLNSPPSLISWGNNLTNDQTLDLIVNANEQINFNITATQSITSWNWLINDIDQNINSDNFTTSFSFGTHTITVNAANINGTSNTIPWTVTATLAPRSVTSIAVTDGGSDYKSVPTITISGGGETGATATAIVVPRSVTGITVTNGGTGYTYAPTINFTGGGGTGANATATLQTPGQS